MTILGYSIPQIRKAVASFIFVLGSIAVLLISGYDPSFTEAVAALAGSVIGVATVFMTKNHTAEDLSKAAMQLQAAGLTVVGFYTTINPNTVEQIAIAVGGLISAYAVFRFRNGGKSAL